MPNVPHVTWFGKEEPLYGAARYLTKLLQKHSAGGGGEVPIRFVADSFGPQHRDLSEARSKQKRSANSEKNYAKLHRRHSINVNDGWYAIKADVRNS